MSLRLARTNSEAYLYMSRQPCETCGVSGFQPERSASETVDGVLARRYMGACPSCGLWREFVFRVPDNPSVPVDDGRSFGDERPSELLDPGEWLELSDAMLTEVPDSPVGLTDAQRRAAYGALEAGIAALEEVRKFVRPGADSVSPFAFWTERGRRLSLDSRWRFDAERLRGTLENARAALAGFAD
jgi:hypothetical protein